jgi:hypothetical protein
MQVGHVHDSRLVQPSVVSCSLWSRMYEGNKRCQHNQTLPHDSDTYNNDGFYHLVWIKTVSRYKLVD